MPLDAKRAINYINQRKKTHPEEFEDPTPTEYKEMKTGFATFMERVESGKVGDGTIPVTKTIDYEDWENSLNKEKLETQEKTEKSNKKNQKLLYKTITIGVIIGLIAGGFMGLILGIVFSFSATVLFKAIEETDI